MASLFRIDFGKISVAPDSRLLKAAEWANYVASDEILDAAKRYAENLRHEAEVACAEEKTRAYEQGLLEGRLEHAEQMMETVLKSIDYIEGLEKGVLALVGDALRKILGSLPPEELMLGVVRQALTLVRGQRRVTLCVPPEDEEIVKKRLQDIQREYASIDFLDLRADARLSKGACILQSEMGIVDAGVETQIRAIINTLEKKRKG